jgi:hypothetical protein
MKGRYTVKTDNLVRRSSFHVTIDGTSVRGSSKGTSVCLVVGVKSR